jgi:hypothetical protein
MGLGLNLYYAGQRKVVNSKLKIPTETKDKQNSTHSHLTLEREWKLCNGESYKKNQNSNYTGNETYNCKKYFSV